MAESPTVGKVILVMCHPLACRISPARKATIRFVDNARRNRKHPSPANPRWNRNFTFSIPSGPHTHNPIKWSG